MSFSTVEADIESASSSSERRRNTHEAPRYYVSTQHTSHEKPHRNLLSDYRSHPTVGSSVPLLLKSGSYHANLYVGTPPQHKLVIVDTGSHFTAFPCEPCLSCGSSHYSGRAYYDPEVSSSSQSVRCRSEADEKTVEDVNCVWKGVSHCSDNSHNQCTHTQRYTEGSSWTAYEMRDLVYVGTHDLDSSYQNAALLSSSFVFGCEVSESGLFRSQYADGIMGLAMYPDGIMQALSEGGSVSANCFSLCLKRDFGYFIKSSGQVNKEVTNDGGILSLGGILHESLKRRTSGMAYTRMTRSFGWYSVHVVELWVGDEVVVSDTEKKNKKKIYPAPSECFNEDKGTIIDSGTTDTYFPEAIAKNFRLAWETSTQKLLGDEWIPHSNSRIDITYETYRHLPPVTIVLTEDVRWSIQPSSYLEPMPTGTGSNTAYTDAPTNGGEDRPGGFPMWEGKRPFVNRIYLDESRGAVLGSNAMLDHELFFDEENLRIGIATADCGSSLKDGVLL